MLRQDGNSPQTMSASGALAVPERYPGPSFFALGRIQRRQRLPRILRIRQAHCLVRRQRRREMLPRPGQVPLAYQRQAQVKVVVGLAMPISDLPCDGSRLLVILDGSPHLPQVGVGQPQVAQVGALSRRRPRAWQHSAAVRPHTRPRACSTLSASWGAGDEPGGHQVRGRGQVDGGRPDVAAIGHHRRGVRVFAVWCRGRVRNDTQEGMRGKVRHRARVT